MGKIAMGIVIGITVSRFPPISAVDGRCAEGELFSIQKLLITPSGGDRIWYALTSIIRCPLKSWQIGFFLLNSRIHLLITLNNPNTTVSESFHASRCRRWLLVLEWNSSKQRVGRFSWQLWPTNKRKINISHGIGKYRSWKLNTAPSSKMWCSCCLGVG